MSFYNTGSIAQIDFSGIQIPGSRPPPKPDLEDPLVILDLIKNNPHERALLKERNPPLSDALESGNTGNLFSLFLFHYCVTLKNLDGLHILNFFEQMLY